MSHSGGSLPATAFGFSTGAIINTTMDKAVVALIAHRTSTARGADFLCEACLSCCMPCDLVCGMRA
jgi:hypothetical protein